jgi:hypothetical protein
MSSTEPGPSATDSDRRRAAADLSTASEDGAKSQMPQAGPPLRDSSSATVGVNITVATTADAAATTQSPPPDAVPPPELVAEQDETIEAAESNADSDEFEPSEWGDDAGASTASTSINSSIYMHTYENGRRYHSYKNGRYPIPNDDQEQNREDMKHVMMLEMTDGKLVYAPVVEHPQKIIDIGKSPKTVNGASISLSLICYLIGQWAIEGS